MATTACPTCRAKLAVPRDAAAGESIACPDCGEVFVPPQLQKKPYDPIRDEADYDVQEAVADRDRGANRRRAKGLMAQGREEERQRRTRSHATPGATGGIEGVLLVMSLVAAVLVPLGYLVGNLVAKRAPAAGEMVLIVGAYCGTMLAFGVKVLRRKARIER